MEQNFFIKQNSILPELRMELINDGRGDFHKIHHMIQNSTITFTMTNINNGIVKIANQPCIIKEKENNGCTTEFVICYQWKKRDTKDKGIFKGEIKIDFNDDLSSEDDFYPYGTLIVPIREDLIITIK